MRSPMPSCPPVVTRVRALTFEEASAQIAPMARVSYVQLERGPAWVHGSIARSNGVVIARLGGTRNRIVRVESAPGRLLIVVGTRGTARVGTSAVGASDAIVLNRATDLVAFCDSRFLSVAISVEQQALEQALADLRLDVRKTADNVRVLQLSGEQLHDLMGIAREVFESESDPSIPAALSAAAVEDLLLRWCAASLRNQPERRHGIGAAAARRRAALRAREFVDTHLDQPLSLAIVCRASYTSARALEYGFRELFELSPMAYVRLARLSRVRRDLCAPNGHATVTQFAGKWGFGHLGQFSKDYYALFGELPSATLSRAAARADTQPVTPQSERTRPRTLDGSVARSSAARRTDEDSYLASLA